MEAPTGEVERELPALRAEPAAMPDRGGEVAERLRALASGAASAEDDADRLLDLFYDALGGATDLFVPAERVRELRVRWVGEVSERDRQAFCAFAATAARHVLVGLARSARAANARGERSEPDAVALEPDLDTVDVIALDDALDRLRERSAHHAEVVTLRWLGGLDDAGVGAVLDIPVEAVARTWRFARAWMLRALDATPRGATLGATPETEQHP